MDLGHIKTHRELINKAFYKDSEKVHLWLHLLLRANWIEREEMFAGKPIKCKPGQFTTGRKQLSIETGINESKIERILTYFEKIEHQIEQQKSSVNRLISIVNWCKFQQSEQRNEQQVNNDRTTSEQRVNTPKEVKEVKEYKELKNKEEAQTPKFNFKNELISIGVDEQIASDWVRVRKTKKAADTKTAFNAIKKEIELSKQTPNECIKTAVEKSWAGFKAEWLKNIQPQLFGQQSASDIATQRTGPRKTKEQIEMDELHKQFRK